MGYNEAVEYLNAQIKISEMNAVTSKAAAKDIYKMLLKDSVQSDLSECGGLIGNIKYIKKIGSYAEQIESLLQSSLNSLNEAYKYKEVLQMVNGKSGQV